MKKQAFVWIFSETIFPSGSVSIIICKTEDRRIYPLARIQRIGVLGGAFDPVHTGHIRMACGVMDTGLLDLLLVLPAGDPPYKRCVAGAEDRWKMVVAACSADQRLTPSRLEIDRSGKSFSADTLKTLRNEYPEAELYYIIGTDAFMNLRCWHQFKALLPLCRFLVCPRLPAMDKQALDREIRYLSSLGAKVDFIPVTPVPVSSSEIRASLAEGILPSSLDCSIQEYCSCKGLYGLPGKLDHIDLWIEKLFASLKPARFAHSLSVALTARRLAQLHGLNPLKAEQAGLLHDCAKCLPLREMQRIATENALTSDRSFLENSSLLHSIVGARVASETYGMDDPEVLEAIAFHNTGNAGMSRLAMCVCLADSIEPHRGYYPGLEQVRELSLVSLERSLLMSLESTAEYVRSRGLYLHPRTKDTILWLRTLPEVSGHPCQAK